MLANRVFLAFALSGSLAAQSLLPIVNLGGGCGGAAQTIAPFPSFLAFTMTPPSIGLLVIGFTDPDPALPIPGCSPCVLHASLDILFLMPPSPASLQLAIPPVPIGTVYAQGVQLPGGCTTFLPGFDFNLTNGFKIN